MALKLSTDLKNFIISKAMVEGMCGTCGTSGTASLNIYNGTQPANGDTGTNGTLLCTIAGIGWGDDTGATTSGTSGLANTAGYAGTAVATGTAGWARMETVATRYDGSAGTFRIDGDCGTAATAIFKINSAAITSGGLVTLVSCPISLP